MPDPHRNVELKAVDPDPARSLAICRKLGASDEGVLTQRDTYYVVARGRLKLREQRPGAAHLIQYERAARPEQRESRYRIAEVADAAAAHAALEAALGVECVVAKRRRLFLWRGVRIHLDEVEGLGSFVELEAVAEPGRTCPPSTSASRRSATRWRSTTRASLRTATPSCWAAVATRRERGAPDRAASRRLA